MIRAYRRGTYNHYSTRIGRYRCGAGGIPREWWLLRVPRYAEVSNRPPNRRHLIFLGSTDWCTSRQRRGSSRHLGLYWGNLYCSCGNFWNASFRFLRSLSSELAPLGKVSCFHWPKNLYIHGALYFPVSTAWWSYRSSTAIRAGSCCAGIRVSWFFRRAQDF